MFDANYKQEELYRFLDLHFQPVTGYTSKVLIAYDSPFCKNKFGIFHNYQTGREDSFTSFPYVYDGENAYYITANGFQRKNLRRINNLFTLHNLVVDIDCHTYNIDAVDIKRELSMCEEYLTEYFHSNIDLPCPNTIVKTGRGFQLWWAILPVPAKDFRSVYEQTVDYFCDKIGAILRKCPFLSLMHVDNAASRKISGLFRLPGTFNRKTRSYGSFEILHENLLDMVFYFYNNIAEPKYSFLPYKRRRKFSLSEYRTKILNRLVTMRRNNGVSEEGYRDLYCFIFFNIRADESTVNKAWQETLEFNSRFLRPLSEKKLEKYLSTSMRKIYHFSNKTIISYLNITEEEQKILHFFPSKNREERRKEKRLAKQERNQTIIVLSEKGFSQRAIAVEAGCSQATVSRVLKKEKERLEKMRMSMVYNHDVELPKNSNTGEEVQINTEQAKQKKNPILDSNEKVVIPEKEEHTEKMEVEGSSVAEGIETKVPKIITKTYCILLMPDHGIKRKKQRIGKKIKALIKDPP